MDKTLISIIIPTYNRPELLARTLDSIVKQSYKEMELVIVNDAGVDVENFANSLRKYSQLSSVQYYSNEKNKGLAGTRNVAIQKATGDYFVFLDDDDILLPYALEFRMYMMKKLKAEIVYTRALQDIWEKREDGSYISKHKQLYWDSPFDRDLILIQNIAPCCCPMFSRKAWNDSDNYLMDETMTTTEDHDFWIALSRKTDFHELKLIDCECSYRTDKTQMTGRDNFAPNWIKTFKRWRHTAKDLEMVKNHQNSILKKVGINPQEYGL